jgi:hydrogenase maturation protease
MIRAPLLVLAVGNPSRGDDALGPTFLERAEAALAAEVGRGWVEFLTDFQLQVEHALDVADRDRVIFVDASASAVAPFTFERIVAKPDAGCLTHALAPEAVLETQRRLGGPAPAAWVLAIRGERFELGEPLSAEAGAHLDAALAFFLAHERSAGSS